MRFSGTSAFSRSAASTWISCCAPPAPALRQSPSGHSSPSTGNARSCGRSPLLRRSALRTAPCPDRPAASCKDTAIGGDDQLLMRQCFRRLNQLAGRSHRIRQFNHRLWRFGMHQNGRLRIERLHAPQRLSLELVMDNAGALPTQHVGAGLLLHVAAEMAIRRPDDLLARLSRCSISSTAMLEVTTQSARALTAAEVFA